VVLGSTPHFIQNQSVGSSISKNLNGVLAKIDFQLVWGTRIPLGRNVKKGTGGIRGVKAPLWGVEEALIWEAFKRCTLSACLRKGTSSAMVRVLFAGAAAHGVFALRC